jgi:hypothetical protein
MLKFILEYHSFKKMPPSTRTTLIITLISIFALLIPYLPIRRGSPPLLSSSESGVPPTALSKSSLHSENREVPRDKALDRDSEYTATESLNSQQIIEQSAIIQDAESVEKSELEPRKSQDSEPQLQTDSLDDLDSFLDSEQ